MMNNYLIKYSNNTRTSIKLVVLEKLFSLAMQKKNKIIMKMKTNSQMIIKIRRNNGKRVRLKYIMTPDMIRIKNKKKTN